MNESPRPLTLKTRMIAGLLTGLVKTVCVTLRIREVGRERMEKTIRENNGAILVTWHGQTMVPLWRVRNRRFLALISLSRDGDLQCENFRRLGYAVVRGSTGRRGAAATREILKAMEGGAVLAFTPDGPRGPARQAQEGVVYFAKKTGRPILPVGCAARPARTLRSWDSYLLPGLFGRAALVWDEPLVIGADEGPEAACRRVSEAIDAAQARAESLLTAGVL